jgi:hypothetical protein
MKMGQPPRAPFEAVKSPEAAIRTGSADFISVQGLPCLAD